jgi:hypothetical protein
MVTQSKLRVGFKIPLQVYEKGSQFLSAFFVEDLF